MGTVHGVDRGETPSTRTINTTAPLTGGGTLAADLTLAIAAGGIGPTELASTAVTPASYTSANITVDQDGRITAASNITAASIGPTQLANTAVAAGSYVNVNATVDAQGRITAMTSSIGSGSPDGSVTGVTGQRYTDSVTGVMWQNTDGAQAWDPTSIPPSYGYYYFEDLVSNTNFTSTTIGSGTAAGLTATATNPGVQRTTQAVAGVDGFAFRSSSAAMLAGGGAMRFRCLFKLTALSNATDNLVVRLGPGDLGTFADNTDGAYYEYDLATNGDHNWRLCTASNNTRTKTDTGIVATSGAFVLFSLTVNAGGTSVTGKIGGVTVATPVTTNIPTGAGRVFSSFVIATFKQLGAGSMTADLDWIDFYKVLSTSR